MAATRSRRHCVCADCTGCYDRIVEKWNERRAEPEKCSHLVKTMERLHFGPPYFNFKPTRALRWTCMDCGEQDQAALWSWA